MPLPAPAGPPPQAAGRPVLDGPVDVCVAIPRLAVDRPFTYLLRGEEGAGVGTLVSVPFHGRTVNGWVLGPAAEVPPGRLLPVRAVRSPVRFFDETMLALLRWMSERYLAPIAAVIERSHPPRVASEEVRLARGGAEVAPPSAPEPPHPPRRLGEGSPRPSALEGYGGADRLLEPVGITWLRPLPGEEAVVALAAVEACLAAGKRAIVLVPEAEPVPETARLILERVGERAVAFVGGERRSRYRTWLEINAGRFDVVVGTRPAVFAPVARLGLVWISREAHPGHREGRAPYYRVAEVAAARARIEGGVCVLCSLSPSVETAVAARAGKIRVARPPRVVERRAAPLVEPTNPEGEDRSSRLGALLKRSRSAALIVSRRGYGVARVCRACGEPAVCAVCRGPILIERGSPTCGTCGASGRCHTCGAADFGVERGGAERVAQWARNVAAVPVELATGERPAPGDGRVVVGTAAAVNDVGGVGLDLVAILDPDRALARPGIHAGERSLATWMEAAAWARRRDEGGRVLVQTRRVDHPAIQALVRWEPTGFLLDEAQRRTEAGFPPGHPVFKITGRPGLAGLLRSAGAFAVLSSDGESSTVCLVTVSPEMLPSFRKEVLRLAGEGVIERVEAEPQL